MIGYDEGLILSSAVGEVLGSKLGIDEGTGLGFSYGSFDISNDVTLEGLWIEGLLESYNGNALGYFDGTKVGIFEGSTMGV